MPGKMFWGVKLVVVLVVICIGLFFYDDFLAKEGGEIFPGVHGPKASSVMPTPAEAKLKEFSSGNHSRLAILLLDTDAAWLGIAHGLKSIGIPFVITENYKEALQHQVVIAYPLGGKDRINDELAKAFVQFSSSGGALIGINVGEDPRQIFGLKTIIQSDQRHYIKLNENTRLELGRCRL
jgi:hypothetical protein